MLAFRGKCSLLIEAKTSRADFFADFKKPERQSDAGSGLGVYRLYLCPAELLTIGDIPPKWGLLWARGRRIEAIKVPLGNTWPDHRTAQHYPNNWALYAHVPDQSAERAIMYSVARRRLLTPPSSNTRRSCAKFVLTGQGWHGALTPSQKKTGF